MMKISALNEESSEESDEENIPTITKEAQEQIALTEYNKALELLKEQKINDALHIFKDLLETELLDQVEKPEVSDGRTRPMLSLKYCCFKNIGAIYSQLENYEDAIDSYWEAANLDNSDVMLWCRMGTLAIKTANLEFACSAFKQGLKCNPNHWPCLDNIITATYAVPDFMNCLLYISMALERDPSYIKGLAFRERIFKEVPYFEQSYKLFNKDWALDPPLDTEFDRDVGEKLIVEAKEVAEKWIEYCKPDFQLKPLPDLTLNRPIKQYTWLDLGESLISMHNHITDNNYNFVNKIKFVFQKDSETESTEKENKQIGVDSKAEDTDNPVIDISSEVDSATDVEMEFKLEDDHPPPDPEMVDLKLESEMDIDDVHEEEKSDSSDVRIIDDDELLKADAADVDANANTPQNTTEAVGNEKPPSNNSVDGNTAGKRSEDADEADVYQKEAEKSAEKLTTKPDDKPGEAKDEQQKVKKRRRSSLCFLQQWAWSSNNTRRSARVRGSNRREAEREDVVLEETMRRILPATLLPDTVKIIRDDPMKNADDSMDTMDLYQLFANRESMANDENPSPECSKSPSPDANENSKYFGSEAEKNDVLEFINVHNIKSNMMIIVARFTEFLSTKWSIEWPKELVDVYLQAYLFTREHIPHSPPLGDSIEEESILKYDAEMALLFAELHTDKWLDHKPDVLPTATIETFGTGMPSEELGHIIFASVKDDRETEENFKFLVRVLWVKANLFLCQGDAEIAIKTLELLRYDMENMKQKYPSMLVKLPNCKYNPRISVSIVQKRLMSIERGQKLGEVQKLYDEKKYAELYPILQDTFKFTKERSDVCTNVKLNVDRISQLSMLLDSLWNLEMYEDCYIWAEECLNEAWSMYINSSEEADQKKWSASLQSCLEKSESCVEMIGSSVVRYLPDTRVTRLVQSLIQIICHQLDVADGVSEMPLTTTTPWILLHHILQYEDDKERAKSRTTPKSRATDTADSDSEDEDKDIPAPLMILFTGHEFLGRHGWCCTNDGKLLLFTIKTVIPRMCGVRYTAVREKIEKHLEQIFWCLYGHPNRPNKTKPKHLEDHITPYLPLTWDIAQLLFEFYKPTTLPEFDTAKSLSITADTKILFKKISSLVPREHDPCSLLDEITAYIVGESDKMPTVKKPLPFQVEQLYYLLGDYSFKNSNWTSATKYFSMDVCLHPKCFNSWVPLAMSAGTLMGTSLNNCKPLPDITKLLSQAKLTQCCYRQAVELKPGHSVIWIEYGNFVYMVHSFCSRLLKQESDTLSMEKFAILETRKEEALDIAENCFNSANRIYLANIDDAGHIQDERWLYHYMLAKISEKKNQDPPVFLEHYATASELLYKNNAYYPKRINHKVPHCLSIEALEVHYRIHACILKYLEQHEGKPLKKSLGDLFLKQLLDCAGGPFMQFPSKLNKHKRKESPASAERAIEERDGIPVLADAVAKVRTASEKRQNSVEEIPVAEKIDSNRSKTESKKRPREGSSYSEESSKKIKLENISHVQVMKDVLSLVDDLITKVCEASDARDTSSDEVMVISSDESECARPQKLRNADWSKVRSKSDGGNDGKPDSAQDIMDTLIKQSVDMVDVVQSAEGKLDKWNDEFQGGDYAGGYLPKEKPGEKKKTQVNAMKEKESMSRRGSQESTTTTLTTTTNETNNSSFSSSDESSSSDDSSDSDSSSAESDSESDSDTEKKKSRVDVEEKEEFYSEAEVAKLISYCLAGLEQCILRFPEHYKSIYRLCHFFFNHKAVKDNSKCRDLLLGTYKCQYYSGLTFQGLFADRKNTNFFNGVWRIPNDEIDRPGSFASHMSRCVTLLMQVLKETDDSRMLMELCVQLRKTPDADKKYVRDSEREQLSRQALTLCLQSLRTRVQSMGPPNPADSALLCRTDMRTHVLLDVYKIYQKVQKNFQGKEVQAFATLLVDTYKAYMGIKTAEGNILEVAMRCCQQQNLANKIAASNSAQNSAAATVSTAPVVSSALSAPVSQSQPAVTSAQIFPPKKTSKTTGTGRPRGRPPNINKHLQNLQQASMMNQQFNANKRGFSNYLGSSGSQSLMNPFFMNTLMDQSMISAMLSSGLSGNMLDPMSTVNYFNQLGSYQDILRQYQSNLSSLANYGNLATSMPNVSNIGTPSASVTSGLGSMPATSLSSLGNMAMPSNLTVQQLLNLSSAAPSTTTSSAMMYPLSSAKSGTSTSSSKDIHGVSITPVTSSMQHKPKSVTSHISKAMPAPQPPKSMASVTPATQVSLLKPSVIQQPKNPPPKQMSAPQLRVSKTLTEPQPAHTASLSPLKSASPSGIGSIPPGLQNPGLNITPVPMGMPPRSSGGTSLQHKLQQKKQPQQIPLQKPLQNPVKKPRPKTKSTHLPSNLQSLLSLGAAGALPGPSYLSSELSGLSVSAISQPNNPKLPSMKSPVFRKTASKPKPMSLDMPGAIQAPMPTTNTSETLNMLSQLQQHSHLEIIPQSKTHGKPSVDYSKNMPLSMNIVPQKPMDNLRSNANSDSANVYDFPRAKSASSSKKTEKHSKDSVDNVEIITLDD